VLSQGELTSGDLREQNPTLTHSTSFINQTAIYREIVDAKKHRVVLVRTLRGCGLTMSTMDCPALCRMSYLPVV
jgi:hypothetical protein